MSTKIHNAVRFDSKMTLEQVVKWVNKLRPEVQEMMYAKHEEQIWQGAVAEFDKMTMEGIGWRFTEARGSAIGRAIDMIRHDEESMEKHVGEKKAELQVFVQGKHIYGLFNVDDNIMQHIRTVHEGKTFTDYSYWDNTDRPDEVSGKEWGQRRKVWKALFKDVWSLREVAMTFLLSKDQVLQRSILRFMKNYRDEVQPQHQEIMDNFIPSLKTRGKRMHDYVDDAPWKPDFSENNGSWAPVLKYLREIERDEIPSFVTAYPFLMAHALEHTPTVEMLWMQSEELTDHFKARREAIFALDVPIELRTPKFEALMLAHTTPSNAPEAPRKKI